MSITHMAQSHRENVRKGIEGVAYFVTMFTQSTEELLGWMELDPQEQEHAEPTKHHLYGASQAVRRLMEEIDQGFSSEYRLASGQVGITSPTINTLAWCLPRRPIASGCVP